MELTLAYAHKATYVHAVVSGDNSTENVKSYLRQIRQECSRLKCSRVLIEERLVGPRLGITDVFRIVSEQSSLAVRQFEAIAYVDVNAEGDLMKFAEDVAVNRHLRVAVFSTVPDAEKWLLQLSSSR